MLIESLLHAVGFNASETQDMYFISITVLLHKLDQVWHDSGKAAYQSSVL